MGPVPSDRDSAYSSGEMTSHTIYISKAATQGKSSVAFKHLGLLNHMSSQCERIYWEENSAEYIKFHLGMKSYFGGQRGGSGSIFF